MQKSQNYEMGTVEDETIRRRTLILWLMVGIITGPLAIVTHEAGHFFAAQLLGYSEVSFHYASINRGLTPRAIESLYDRGFISVAGPVITWIMALGCCYYAKQNTQQKFIIALGISAPLRNLASVAALVLVFTGQSVSGNDEVKVANFFEIHPAIPLLVSIAVLVITWIYLFRLMLREHGKLALVAAFVGIVLGNVLWLTLLGPTVIP